MLRCWVSALALACCSHVLSPGLHAHARCSSVKVSEQVIKVAAATLEPQPHQAKPPPVASSAHFHAQQQQQERRQQQRRQGEQEGVLSGEDGAAALEEGLLGGGATAAVAGPAQPAAGLNGLAAALPPAPPRPRPLPTVVSGVALDDTYDAISHFRGLSRDRAAAALEQAPRFLILDFRCEIGSMAVGPLYLAMQRGCFATLHWPTH